MPDRPRRARGPIDRLLHRARRWSREVERSSSRRLDDDRQRIRVRLQLSAIPIALLAVLLVAPRGRTTVVIDALGGRLWVDPGGVLRAEAMSDSDLLVHPWPAGQPMGRFRVERRLSRSGWPAAIAAFSHDPVIMRDGVVVRPTPGDPVGDAIRTALERSGEIDPGERLGGGGGERQWIPGGLLLNAALGVMLLWLLIAVLETPIIFLARRLHNAGVRRRRVLAARGRCAHCGYDLRGLEWSERCPECGELS